MPPALQADAESTSRTLLERVRGRDADAWRRFAALYGPVVYRWALNWRLQPHDAADVVQDVFQSVAQNIERFERRNAGAGLRGWLWTIARNKVRDLFRKRQTEPVGAGGTAAQHHLRQVPNLDDADNEPVETTAAELSQRAMRLIQTEFEASTWQAFLATAVEGKSAADTARDLSLTTAAVYKAKSRVLLRLRRELDGLLD